MLVLLHMNKLLSLDIITTVTNTIGMRNLNDELKTKVRNLGSLGLDAINYGPS